MKRLILIFLLLFAFKSNAQFTDKVAHFGVGYVVGSISSGIVLTHSNGRNEWLKSLSVGFASSAIIGLSKEIYDYKDYGKFDYNDLGATILGGTLGSLTIKININRYERKHII